MRRHDRECYVFIKKGSDECFIDIPPVTNKALALRIVRAWNIMKRLHFRKADRTVPYIECQCVEIRNEYEIKNFIRVLKEKLRDET